MNLTPPTKRMAILGTILLGCVAAWGAQWEILAMVVTGLFSILKDEVQRSKELDSKNGSGA